MPAAQLEFAGFLTPAAVPTGDASAPPLFLRPIVRQYDNKTREKPVRTLYLDECKPSRKRKKKEPTPEQARKRFERARRRRDRLDAQSVECCLYLYHRTRACHTWWSTCFTCRQPLKWPSWQ